MVSVYLSQHRTVDIKLSYRYSGKSRETPSTISSLSFMHVNRFISIFLSELKDSFIDLYSILPSLSQESVTLHDVKDTFVVVGHPRKKLWRRITVVGAADKQDPFGLAFPRVPILEIKRAGRECCVKFSPEIPYLAALFLAFRTIYSDRHERAVPTNTSRSFPKHKEKMAVPASLWIIVWIPS